MLSPPLLPHNSVVATLIAADGYWNVDLIADSFWECEVDAILSIHVP